MDKLKTLLQPYINQIIIVALLLCGIGGVYYIKHMDVKSVQQQQQLPDENWPK